MLVVRFTPEIIMALLRTGQTFQSEDGARLCTVIQGIPNLPLAGIGLASSAEVLPFPPVPDCVYELCLEDHRAAVSNQEIIVHSMEAQGLPHDFTTYAQHAYKAYHSGLAANPLFPWHKLQPIVQAAWRAVAVRVARLTTHTLAEQTGDENTLRT